MTHITYNAETQALLSRPTAAAEAKSLFSRLIKELWVWNARSESRRSLAALDDRLLQDIGLDRADVNREISKPFWSA